MAQVHVRFEGNSWDWDLNELDLGDLSSDADVKAAVGESARCARWQADQLHSGP